MPARSAVTTGGPTPTPARRRARPAPGNSWKRRMHRLRSRTCQWMTTAAGAASSGAHGQRARSVRPHRRIPQRWMHRSQRRSRSSAVSDRRVDDSRWIGRGRRSSQTRPVVSSGAPSSAASHTSVSAPCSGLHSSGAITRRNVGNDLLTPGVSAQRGASRGP